MTDQPDPALIDEEQATDSGVQGRLLMDQPARVCDSCIRR